MFFEFPAYVYCGVWLASQQRLARRKILPDALFRVLPLLQHLHEFLGARFRLVLRVAIAGLDSLDYTLQFGCVSGDDSGAMGLHYVNSTLVNGAVLDATRPQIIIYEPTPEGGRRLIGVDYLLLADPWNASHSGPPQLMGQLFHLFPSPNRFGLPAFYTLHVWAWKDNPSGAFVNWHSNVSCEAYTPQ